MLVSLKLTSREVIEVKKSKTRRAAIKFNKICFSRRGGVAPSWRCHTHFQGVKWKLRLRPFCWCIVCFCTSNGFFQFLNWNIFRIRLLHPVHKLVFVLTFRTIYVHNMFSTCSSLKFSCTELLIQWTICCHIFKGKIRASDIDLPVLM